MMTVSQTTMPCIALLSGEKFIPVPSIEPGWLKFWSARLEIWRSEVQFPVQLRIFLLNLNCISQGTNYKFVFTYQFDLKTSK